MTEIRIYPETKEYTEDGEYTHEASYPYAPQASIVGYSDLGEVDAVENLVAALSALGVTGTAYNVVVPFESETVELEVWKARATVQDAGEQ